MAKNDCSNDGIGKRRDFAVGILCCGKVVAVTNRGMTYKEARKRRKQLKWRTQRPVVLSPDHPAIREEGYDSRPERPARTFSTPDVGSIESPTTTSTATTEAAETDQHNDHHQANRGQRPQRLDEIVMQIEQAVEGTLGSSRFIELAPTNRNGSGPATHIQLSANFDTADIDATQAGRSADNVDCGRIAEQTATRLREYATWINDAANSIVSKCC